MVRGRFGKLTRPMLGHLRKLVAGKEVVDLGAGDLTFTRTIHEMGAKKVTAVECGWANQKLPKGGPALELVGLKFEDWLPKAPMSIDVAFLSWPPNYALPGLVEILHRSKSIYYVGCNYNAMSCGNRALYEYLLLRKIVASSESEMNTMIIYGKKLDAPRVPKLLEEVGAQDRGNIHWTPTAGKLFGGAF